MTGNTLIVGYGNPLRGDRRRRSGWSRGRSPTRTRSTASKRSPAISSPPNSPSDSPPATRVVLIDAAAGPEAGRSFRHAIATRAGARLDPRPPCRTGAVAAHGAGALRPIAGGLSGYGGRGFARTRRRAVGAGHGGAARGHRDGAPIGAEAPAGCVTEANCQQIGKVPVVICGRPRLASGHFDVLIGLVGCGHMSGLWVRRLDRWP